MRTRISDGVETGRACEAAGQVKAESTRVPPSITLILVIPLVQRRKCLSTKPTSENVGRACRYYDSGSWASGAPCPAGPSATRIWQDVVASRRVAPSGNGKLPNKI